MYKDRSPGVKILPNLAFRGVWEAKKTAGTWNQEGTRVTWEEPEVKVWVTSKGITDQLTSPPSGSSPIANSLTSHPTILSRHPNPDMVASPLASIYVKHAPTWEPLLLFPVPGRLLHQILAWWAPSFPSRLLSKVSVSDWSF